MQAPQPVQDAASTSMPPTGPLRRSNLKARVSQTSVQLRHDTPHSNKQPIPSVATSDQGTCDVSWKTSSLHASTQTPQKVQVPATKSSLGVPAGPAKRIFSGQALMQSPQEVQAFLTVLSLVHGGLCTLLRHPPDRRADFVLAVGWSACILSLALECWPAGRRQIIPKRPANVTVVQAE